MNCYNCGIGLDDVTNHVEHIPAKNLFATHPDEYKQNLLTVPACYKCNVELYSKIDQEIRDAVGILNDSDELKIELTKKAIRSIMRKNNWKDRFFLLDNGNSFEVSFSYNDIISLHIKNFKGLFYAKYNKPISNEYGISVIAEGDENNTQAQTINTFFRDFLNYDSNWNTIGHSKVFKYKIKAIIKGENDVFYDGENIDKAIGFVCIMEYHETIRPLVYALSKEFMKNITLHNSGLAKGGLTVSE